jgi:hypothetical protein
MLTATRMSAMSPRGWPKSIKDLEDFWRYCSARLMTKSVINKPLGFFIGGKYDLELRVINQHSYLVVGMALDN